MDFHFFPIERHLLDEISENFISQHPTRTG